MCPNKNIFIQLQYALIFLFLHQSCVSQAQVVSRKKENVRALTLISTIPMPGQEDTSIAYFNGHETLFEVPEEGLNIFKISAFHHFSETKLNKDGDYISDRFIRTDTSYYYIVFKPGDKTGLKYDSVSQTVGTRIPVDSFMKTATIFMLDTFVVRKSTNDGLVFSVWSNDKRKLTETYLPVKKPDESYSDSTVLEFESALNDYSFSLSKEADKRNNMKLSLVKMIYNRRDFGATAYSRAARVIAFRIAPADITPDKKDIERLLQTYKKEKPR